MPTFDTPTPVNLTIELMSGGATVVASDRSDTVVEVVPQDPDNRLDVEAAEQARVDFADGSVTVKVGKRWQAMLMSKVGSVEVTVMVPSGSHARATTYMGDLRAEGTLGDCQFKTYAGDVVVGEVAAAQLTTMLGQVTVDRIGGECHITGTGEIHVRHIGGTAFIKNLNGHTWVGDVAGDVSLKSANGNITVERPAADVNAKTAYGSVHIGDIARGTVVLQSAAGQLEIGIHEGTAAWLDVKSSAGRVRNQLETTGQPEPSGETAEIRGRTSMGDIIIRRA